MESINCTNLGFVYFMVYLLNKLLRRNFLCNFNFSVKSQTMMQFTIAKNIPSYRGKKPLHKSKNFVIDGSLQRLVFFCQFDENLGQSSEIVVFPSIWVVSSFFDYTKKMLQSFFTVWKLRKFTVTLIWLVTYLTKISWK